MNGSSDIYDVIVVGAGVVGPTIATALARQGRRVLIIERDWSTPDRIVGELMQPGGIKALKELGMVQAINDIEAIHVTGYYIKYGAREIGLEYPDKQEALQTNSTKPVPDCVFDGNDKIKTDSTLNAKEWEEDERVRGVAFHNGEFLMRLRSIVKDEPNVTWVEGTATKLIRDDDDPTRVTGVQVKLNQEIVTYMSKLTISCDGIYSRFRKELFTDTTASVGSYFVGLKLIDAKLPMVNHGHVILGSHAPILIYQISPHETRILCAYRSTKPPSQTNNELYDYLHDEVLPALPKETQPSFAKALETRKFRCMPNQYLPAIRQGKNNKGLIMLGDALNMRHPLTGGGMTVGLNDSALLAKLLHPSHIADLDDHDTLVKQLRVFHSKRKNLDAVINTLSVALYSLFAADKNALLILQRGCFKYFLRGGACVSGPIGLLSGMLPFPMLLFNHFFSVAFYAIYLNFIERGLPGFPMALFEAFDTIFTAIVVFTPYLWSELVN